MAQEVTLANVRLDSSGVVTGVEKGDEALKKGATQVEKYGKKVEQQAGNVKEFSNKLFDMKGALLGLGSAIGLTAVFAAVAVGLKTLLMTVLANIEAWQDFKAAVEDTYRSLVQGESDVDRISRKMEDVVTGAGVRGVMPPIGDVLKLTEARAEAQDLRLEMVRLRNFIQESPSVVAEGALAFPTSLRGIFQQVFWGRHGDEGEESAVQTLDAANAQIKIMDSNIEAMSAKLRVAWEAFRDLDGTYAEWQAITKGAGIPPAAIPEPAKPAEVKKPPTFWDIAGVPDPAEQAKKLAIALPIVQAGWENLRIAVIEGRESMDTQLTVQENLTAGLLELGATSAEIWEHMGVDIGERVEAQSTDVEELSMSYQMLGAAAQAAGAAVSQAMFDSSTSAKDAVGTLFKTLASIAMANAMASVAAAISATTGFGAALTGGTASQHMMAAAKWFAVAAGAAMLSRTFGSGGAAGGGGGAGGGGQPQTQIIAPAGPSVTLVINGNWYGVGGGPNAFAREVQRLIRTATSDGA